MDFMNRGSLEGSSTVISTVPDLPPALPAMGPARQSVASASPHEVTLVDQTIDSAFVEHAPNRLIGDKAYDSDGLDERLMDERGVEPIAPHRSNRRRPKTQDGRKSKRYRRRWKVERLFAWLQNFRWLTVL